MTQNFSHRRALLICKMGHATEQLERTLVKLGLSVEYVPLKEERAVLALDALDRNRDVIFLDGDLPSPLGEAYSTTPQLPPVPLIGLVGLEAPSRLKALLNAGATSFLKKPVHGSCVYSTLFLGVNEHRVRFFLKKSAEKHERKRHQRKALIKAILNLMEVNAIDDETAYELLRKESMRHRMNIEDYSQYLLDGCNLHDEGYQSRR
ncbi:ANTAR domain-containing protein [Halomonas daqingensis]|uniref:ANTAR domain-containing protein n=1 Tax=Billgrantia desiderata TaxID=52021 RepID=A0ABS9BBG5_9GAMM|nr:ANTAR domain-containing protein [Halomonas desiderata]MCE8044402.1 ANTAR domain-containing protein [Halomonas desiderata]MCE8048976.1 ANTAR domain-containing protein [Halomonas desiderata]